MTDTLKKKKKAKYSLTDLDVFEVSLVSKPAIGVKYIMTKSAEKPIDDKLHTSVPTEVKIETIAGTSPAEGVNSMNEKLQELLKSAGLELDETTAGALGVLLTPEFKEAVPDELFQSIYKEAGYEVPEIEVEKEVIKEVFIEKTVDPEPVIDSKEEVLKGFTPAQMVLFKEQEEKAKLATEVAEKALKTAEAERSARKNREYIEKATLNYSALPAKAEDLGPVLKAIDEKLEASEAKVVLSMFKAAGEALVASKQLEEIGEGGDGAGDKPADWLDAATALVEKGDFKTRGEAVEHLMSKQPELFMGGN